jgi:hypothetical protein
MILQQRNGKLLKKADIVTLADFLFRRLKYFEDSILGNG